MRKNIFFSVKIWLIGVKQNFMESKQIQGFDMSEKDGFCIISVDEKGRVRRSTSSAVLKIALFITKVLVFFRAVFRFQWYYK